MNMDRKTFLRKGIVALGEMLIQPGRMAHEPEQDRSLQTPGCAVPDNGRCLAQRGGCFTCLEQCPKEAISVEMGKGVWVDPERCDRCGTCEHVCPLTPVAIRVNRL
jgi:ferredoxin